MIEKNTIFALATPPGKSGVAVIRISGPRAKEVLFLLGVNPLPQPRVASLRALYAPSHYDSGTLHSDSETIFREKPTANKNHSTGEMIDRALVLWFPAPKSFTGEDVVELHTHGSQAVVSYLTKCLSLIPGLRMAEPGEFSKKAFENGTMDLTELEGLADLIAAETQLQRKQALRQMEGALGKNVESWRASLLSALALLEASLDFSDEDLPPHLFEDANYLLLPVFNTIAAHLSDSRGERLRSGVHTVILGAPNVGKSSLLNWLAKREVAIVSNIAGTTRDVIEVHMDIGGIPVTLSDTAGLREKAGKIESEGIARANRQAEKADVKLILLDATTWPNIPHKIAALVDDQSLLLLNKIDCMPGDTSHLSLGGRPLFPLSLKTGEGLEALLQVFERHLSGLASLTEHAAFTSARQKLLLSECHASLGRALESFKNPATTLELFTEEVRLAARALGRITGAIEVDEVLGEIFSRFCIGK